MQAFDTIGAPGAPSHTGSSIYAQAGSGGYSHASTGGYSHSTAVSSTHPGHGSQAAPAGFFPAAPPHNWAAPPSPSPERVRGQLSGMVLAGGPGKLWVVNPADLRSMSLLLEQQSGLSLGVACAVAGRRRLCVATCCL